MVLAGEDLEFWTGYEGHYELLLDRDDPIGVVSFEASDRQAEALFLADEPLDGTYVERLGAVVQWIFGDSEQQVLEVAEGEAVAAEWEGGVIVRFSSPPVMIDAASPGARVDDENRLDLPLSPGVYRVSSADVERGRAGARIHQFRVADGD